MTNLRTPLTPSKPESLAFDPVPTKVRHDGWTPDKQIAFIEAFAECGCVEDAARRVGMSKQSAYNLHNRADAKAFQLAWRFASERGAQALGEAAWSRALHGTVTPIFYRGEQVGERRHFDERLTMFLLRHRDPLRFGKWIEKADRVEENPDSALVLAKLLNLLKDNLHGVASTLEDYGLVDCAIDEDLPKDEEEGQSEAEYVSSDDDDDKNRTEHDDEETEGDHDGARDIPRMEVKSASNDAPDAISGRTYPSTSSTLGRESENWECGAIDAEIMRQAAAERRALKAAERARTPRIRSFGPPRAAHLPPWM